MVAPRSPLPLAPILAAVAVSLGCSGCDSSDDPSVAVTIRFAVRAEGAEVACGATYPGLGTSHAGLALADLRFYVHDLALVDASGIAHPVTLTSDGKWQGGRVALLDFEDRTGACENGTPEVNDRVVGRVAPGAYRGLTFKVGVPPELDHLDAATAAPPLDLTSLFWGWTLGYKFLRLDAETSTGAAWSVHLGAIGCTRAGAGAITCAADNVVDVALDTFDPSLDAVVLDLSALLAASDLEANRPPSAGCQSDVDDPDCPAIFARLGLPFAGAPAPGPQVVFRAGDLP